MGRQWDFSYQQVVELVAAADDRERRAYQLEEVPGLVERGVNRENNLLRAQVIDNDANRPTLQELTIKVVEHLRANGYPEACPVVLYNDGEYWILDVSINGDHEEDFEAVWERVVAEAGAEDRFCVHETILHPQSGYNEADLFESKSILDAPA